MLIMDLWMYFLCGDGESVFNALHEWDWIYVRSVELALG